MIKSARRTSLADSDDEEQKPRRISVPILPLLMTAEDDDYSIDASSYVPPHRKPCIKRCYSKMQTMGLTRVFGWLFLTGIYTVFGAWVYRMIESTIDQNERESAYKYQVHLHEIRNVSIKHLINDIKSLAVDRSFQRYENEYERKGKQLESFKELIARYDNSIQIDTSDPKMGEEGWTFINAMFFCCSLYTSIGFGGRLYPRTQAGRLVTMIYSFIGIPFMLSMTSDMGLVIFDGFYWLWWNTKVLLSKIYSLKPAKVVQVENIELARKTERTFPVSYGLILSVLSLLFCSAMCQTFEPKWSFFDANYYMVTSFLTIGLGDISPSAPKDAPQWTLFAHVFMLVFSMTFIGLFQHSLDRRLELSFAYLENLINKYFQNLQDNPGDAFPVDMPVHQKIGTLAAQMSFFNKLYYYNMDQSRSRLLIEIWNRKENLRNQSVQSCAPKRSIGIQHLQQVEPWNDCIVFGEYMPLEYNYHAPSAENIQELKYVYQVNED